MGLKERREREKAARKGQILAAARSLLFKKGIRATSINQIARKAELGVGTIYFYYQSKEEIFYSLQEEGLDILFHDIDAIGRSETTPEERLRATGHAYLRFSSAHKDYFDIINYFLATPSVILGAELVRVGNEAGATRQCMIDAHDLCPQIRGFRTPVFIEDIDAGIDLPEHDARAAVADRRPVREDEKTHRAFERIAILGLQSEHGDRTSAADICDIHLFGICIVEMPGFPVADG